MEQLVNNLPIKYRFNFDSFLMYLIQDVTKRPSAEILNFFNELVVQVAEMGFNNKKGRGIDKRIDDYFPDTAIPFHVRVKGRKSYGGNHWRTGEEVQEHYYAYAEVGFPQCATYIKEDLLKDIQVALMEKALLGGDDIDIKPFEKPPIRSSKMYKSLMDAFAGREPEPKKTRKRKTKLSEGS